MVLAVVAAMLVTSLLFVLYGANPLQAYFALFHEPFATLRGFGYTLVRTAPSDADCPGHHRQLAIGLWLSGFRRMLRRWALRPPPGWLCYRTGRPWARFPGRILAFGALVEFRRRSRCGPAWLR